MNNSVVVKAEKATLIADVVERITPFIKSQAKLSDEVNILTGILTRIMGLFMNSPDDKAVQLKEFINAYNAFLEKNQTNNQMLLDFQTGLMSQATQLIEDYTNEIQAG